MPERCLFWTDEADAPGFQSEFRDSDRVVKCSADATAIVRLKSGAVDGYQGHVLWQAGHLPMCDHHATYLSEDAPITWEVLGAFLDEEEIRDRKRINEEHVPSTTVESPPEGDHA